MSKTFGGLSRWIITGVCSITKAFRVDRLVKAIRSRVNSSQNNDYTTGWEVRVSNAGRSKTISILQIVRPVLGSHPASYSIGTVGAFSAVKVTGA